MQRILYIIDSLGHSGAARQMWLLARGLASQGFDVHIAVLGASATKVCANDPTQVPIAYFGRRWTIDPLADLKLVRHIARLRPDIVHTWNVVPGLIAALGAAFTSRGKAHPRWIAGHYRIERYPPVWDAWWERRFVKRIARLVTNSVAVCESCNANGLPVERLAVIPPGVLPAREGNVARDELLRELHLPSDARLIGVIGRLVPEKRVQDLIWAADLLRVLHDNLRMLIIGDGPLRSQLEQYARMASDLDHIRFLGNRDDVWRIMPHLDVLWNGSDNRGVSLAMLEAMAAGVPVVASDVPVNREVVVHGETGYLIPHARRSGRADRARWTDRLFSDADLKSRIGSDARRRSIETFAAKRMIHLHAELYDRQMR